MADLLWRAVVAGLAGGVAMMIIGQLPRLAGVPSVDLGRIAETKLLRYHRERISAISVGLHFAVSLALALLYGALVGPLLPPQGLLSGVLYGVAVWLVVMLVALPTMGEGLIGAKMGGLVAPISLLMHVAFGAVLGAVFPM